MDNQEPSKLAQENAQARAANLSYGKWKAMQPRQEENPEELPEGWLRCEHCGKPFKKRYGKRFCDIDCRTKAYAPKEKVWRAEYEKRHREKKAVAKEQPKELSDLDRQVIIALANSNMNRASAGRKLNFDRKTIDYHESIIKKITGLDPANFFDLHKLVKLAEWQTIKMAKKKEG